MVKWSIIEYCGLAEKSSCGYCKNAGHKASLGTENGVEDPDEGDSVSFGRMFCSYNGFGEFYAVTRIRVERASGLTVSAATITRNCLTKDGEGLWLRSVVCTTADASIDVLPDVGAVSAVGQTTSIFKRKLVKYLIFRSGKYIYKPTMERTCCPQYTIRLDSTKFILSRSQRKVLRQMNEFLKNDIRPRSSVKEEQPMETVAASSSTAAEQKPHDSSNNSSKKVDKSDNPVQKKKEMRRQRCFARWREKGLDVEEMKKARAAEEEARRRTVESYILEPDDSWKHRLEVKLVRTSSQEFKERYDESFSLFEKYQKIIHKDHDSSKAGFKRFLVDTPLFDDEILRYLHFPNECCHWDPRNLISRPPPGPYTTGSYHQWYILDGRLLAVGVIDILPRCVSSKYMYYDPDYTFLSLGTYTALRICEYIIALPLGIHAVGMAGRSAAPSSKKERKLTGN
ncbi:hypothetical protein Y032_0352g3249 [Ancylostoma ceylanicum]|uniref:Arginyl-tRNA--protein transferase 1 n=1 Tax=Ancylostoma ceylanicum TaxID=53326 RepID=A0A016RX85_9BILA|nr:hypothetical protein Y032_0352g3249 [Ancylostoma ceylanicum]